MKSERKIFIAFLLNLFFSLVEFVGGLFTGSVAIISDAIHDFGDSISIALSFILEKISKKAPNEKYTYGYIRYSVLGGVVTTVVLLISSALVIYNAVLRLINPSPIKHNGVIILAIIGAVVNFAAAYFTHEGESINQKSVNLHMLEDVLGWICVLIGAIIIKFTGATFIDPLLSIAVALFILISAIKNLSSVTDIFLEKTPKGIDLFEIKEHLKEIDGIEDIHHLHIWTIDGINNYATMHIVTDADTHIIKEMVKDELYHHNIRHATIETESTDEHCTDIVCSPEFDTDKGHSHHQHHHHHHH